MLEGGRHEATKVTHFQIFANQALAPCVLNRVVLDGARVLAAATKLSTYSEDQLRLCESLTCTLLAYNDSDACRADDSGRNAVLPSQGRLPYRRRYF